MFPLNLPDANQQNNPPAPSPVTPNKKSAEERATNRRKGVKRSYAETINDEDSSLYLIVRNGRVTLPVKFYNVLRCKLAKSWVKLHLKYCKL